MAENQGQNEGQNEPNISLDSMGQSGNNMNGLPGNLENIIAPVTPEGGTPPAGTPPATVVPQGVHVIPNTQTPPSNTTGDNDDDFDTFISRLAEPTEDDKSLIDTIISTFKGANLDTSGNVLNDKGEIILSVDKLKNFIDKDELPLNDKGDLVNDKGEVIKTALDIQKENSIILAAKTQIENNFGIQFPQDFNVEDSTDGLLTLVEEAVKINNTGTVVKFLESNPELKSYYQHLALGGNPNEYKSTNVNYKAIDVKTLSEDAKLNVLRDMFKQQGNPNVDLIVNSIKQGGEEVLNQNVASALTYLDTKQTQINQQREQQLIEKQQREAQEVNAYWENVNKVIESGKLNNINIPLAERKAFLDYMAKPVTDDASQDMIDAQNDTIETDVLMSYLRYKKFDLSKLAQNIARQEKAQTLTEKFNKLNRQGVTSGVPQNTKSSNPSPNVIDIGTVTGK
jgi:hypothetical protein